RMIRRSQNTRAIQATSWGPSSWVTPKWSSSPGPASGLLAPRISPSMTTLAEVTRWTTARMTAVQHGSAARLAVELAVVVDEDALLVVGDQRLDRAAVQPRCRVVDASVDEDPQHLAVPFSVLGLGG